MAHFTSLHYVDVHDLVSIPCESQLSVYTPVNDKRLGKHIILGLINYAKVTFLQVQVRKTCLMFIDVRTCARPFSLFFLNAGHMSLTLILVFCRWFGFCFLCFVLLFVHTLLIIFSLTWGCGLNKMMLYKCLSCIVIQTFM